MMSGILKNRAVAAGFLATLVASIIFYLPPILSLPEFDIAALLANFVLQTNITKLSLAWWCGLLAFWSIGSMAYPLIYRSLFFQDYRTIYSGNPVSKGIVFGFIAWFFLMIVGMPILGASFFRTPQPITMTFVCLVGHIFYGAVLGAIAKPQYRSTQEEEIQDIKDRAA